MKIKQVEVGMMKNFAYLIIDGDEAAVIDPGFDADKLLEAAKPAIIKKILLTHAHYDHTGAVNDILNKANAEVFAHKKERLAIGIQIDEGDTIKVGNTEIKVLHTPGHTPGGVIYQIGKKLFTGDTLFVEGCGRTDVGGDTETMWQTIQRLKALPDDYEVYPGHDYGTIKVSTIGHEKKHNRFFLCNSREEFFRERLG